jgi:hypothetical protein
MFSVLLLVVSVHSMVISHRSALQLKQRTPTVKPVLGNMPRIPSRQRIRTKADPLDTYISTDQEYLEKHALEQDIELENALKRAPMYTPFEQSLTPYLYQIIC